GVDIICPELANEYGVSSVICLSDKGKTLFESISDEVIYKKVNIRQLIEHNQRIISPAPENVQRKKFNKKITDNLNKIDEICEKFAKERIIKRLARRILKSETKELSGKK